MIADVRAVTDNFETPEKVRDNIVEVALDCLATGIDPAKAAIIIQSKIPAIADLTVCFMNLQYGKVGRADARQKGCYHGAAFQSKYHPLSEAAEWDEPRGDDGRLRSLTGKRQLELPIHYYLNSVT